MNDITPKEAIEILRHYTDLGYGIVIEGEDTTKIKQALDLASETLANGTPYNPTGDLISRSALLNQIDTTDWSDVRLLVEDAPTVEQRDNFDLGYVKGLEDGRNEKPKVISDHFVSFTRTCHICGYSLATYNPEDYKFCPRCGMEF